MWEISDKRLLLLYRISINRAAGEVATYECSFRRSAIFKFFYFILKNVYVFCPVCRIFNAIIFNWSLSLRYESRLRVFENRVLRRVFGPKRDEVTGEWRKLHNEELSDLYSTSCRTS